MSKLVWEQIGSDEDLQVTERLRVFGGWLVLTSIVFRQIAIGGNYETKREDQYTITQTFVPDPNHEWKIRNRWNYER